MQYETSRLDGQYTHTHFLLKYVCVQKIRVSPSFQEEDRNRPQQGIEIIGVHHTQSPSNDTQAVGQGAPGTQHAE